MDIGLFYYQYDNYFKEQRQECLLSPRLGNQQDKEEDRCAKESPIRRQSNGSKQEERMGSRERIQPFEAQL